MWMKWPINRRVDGLLISRGTRFNGFHQNWAILISEHDFISVYRTMIHLISASFGEVLILKLTNQPPFRTASVTVRPTHLRP